MSDFTQTPNLHLYKPTYDADDEMWGYHLNANADVLDAAVMSQAQGDARYLKLSGGTVATLTINGQLVLLNLPTTAPAAGSGVVWNNGGVLCVA